MIGAIIGGALNAIGSLASGNDNWYYQNRAMHEQMAWQEKMNKQQQDWQESMWNKTNEYNSPLAQLERAKEAGINPNAVFGSAGVGGTTATMAQQPTTPSAPNGFSPNFDFGQIGSTVAQLDLMNAQKSNIDADTDKKRAETGNINEDTVMKKWNNFIAPEQWNLQKAEIGASVEKVISEKDLNQEKKNEIKYTVDKMLPLAYDKGLQELDNLKAALSQMHAEIRLLNEKVNTEKAQQGVLAAQEGYIGSQQEGQDMQNKILNLKKQVAVKFGISVDELDGMDKWISTAVANGTYDEAESLLTGELLDRLKKGLVNTAEDPIETVKGIVGLRRGRKGSVANPRPSKYKTKSGKLVTVPSKQ